VDPERKIQQCRTAMLIDMPFWGTLALRLELKEDKELPFKTMGTDGRYLYYDPEYVEKLPRRQLSAVIAHEVMHCVLMHLTRRQQRQPMPWNIAADIATNELIKNDFQLSPGMLTADMFKTFGSFADQSAEYIYSRLPEDKMGGKGPSDDHSPWDKVGKGEGDGSDKGDGIDAGGLEEEWHQATAEAETAAKMAGKLPDHIKQLVEGILNPKLDWRTLLRDWISSQAKNDYRIMPPNKKYIHRGFYLPSITGTMCKVGVAIDTSGSISDEQMKMFLSEVHGICEQYQDYSIDLCTCDAQIHNTWHIEPFDKLPTLMAGRGGTDYEPALEYLSKCSEITSIVYLTDGYPNGGFPKQPRLPIIWVLTEGHGEVPYGVQIVLPNK